MSRMKSVLLFAAAALAFSAANAHAVASPEPHRAYAPASFTVAAPVDPHARADAPRAVDVDKAAMRQSVPTVATSKRPVVVAVLDGTAAISQGTTFAGRAPGPGERLCASSVSL